MAGSAPLVLVALASVTLASVLGCAPEPDAPARRLPVALLGATTAATTARADLSQSIADSEQRLAADPLNAAAAIRLADALLRQTRVAGNAGLAWQAEQAIARIVAADPLDYEACRMLGAVYLSQHRFTDAIAEGQRCLQLRNDDAWVYGVLGDAFLELGRYEGAFDAFDRMLELRPTASAYARASYARELQGDLPGAMRLMQMARAATPPQDPESLAWHDAQLGHLRLLGGDLEGARLAYDRAEHAFPGHPFAAAGRALVLTVAGRLEAAAAAVAVELDQAPTPALLALAGDIAAARGDGEAAENHYRLAEAAWRSDVPDAGALARFLANRGRSLNDALDLARRERLQRSDIFTADTLAWVSFQAGDLDTAAAVIADALRTGTRDRTIRVHAAAIAYARGNVREARDHLAVASPGSGASHLVVEPLVSDLAARIASGPERP